LPIRVSDQIDLRSSRYVRLIGDPVSVGRNRGLSVRTGRADQRSRLSPSQWLYQPDIVRRTFSRRHTECEQLGVGRPPQISLIIRSRLNDPAKPTAVGKRDQVNAISAVAIYGA